MKQIILNEQSDNYIINNGNIVINERTNICIAELSQGCKQRLMTNLAESATEVCEIHDDKSALCEGRKYAEQKEIFFLAEPPGKHE